LRDQWTTVFSTEVKLTEAVAEGEALIRLADDELDILLIAIVNDLMTAVGNDRSAPLYVSFVGKQRPWEIRNPILGDQLETMRPWVATLEASPSPTLKAKAPLLEALIKKADAAIAFAQKAEEALAIFTDLGERKAFVDALNAARGLLHGKLKELAHKNDLPPDFPDRFYKASPRSRGPTIASEERTIKQLEDQLKKHQTIRDSLKAEQAAGNQAREEAEKAMIEKELQATEKEAAEKLAKAAELKAKLGK
jgi:hypothetical protein